MSGGELIWLSGVGGAQCDLCGVTTVVRSLGSWEDGDEQMVCRECIEGNADDWDEPDYGDAS